MVEWVMVAPCMVAWEATGDITGWVCMASSSRIKENNNQWIRMRHISSIFDVTFSRLCKVSMLV